MQLCRNELALYILALEVLFLLISVQCYSFSTTRDTVSNRLIVVPPTNVKRLEPTNLPGVFANSWICFAKRPCLNFCFYPVPIACYNQRWTLAKSSAMFKTAESANLLPFARVPLHVGCLFLYGCL